MYLRAARRPKQFRCALAIAGAADGTQQADAQEPRGAGAVDEAVDLYLEQQRSDPGAVLEATFGALPPLQIPSRDEWDDG